MYYSQQSVRSFDGTRLLVRESGSPERPLLLLIHGGATDADFYVHTAETLSRRFHVVAYTRRGHVGSDLTETAKTLNEATKADKDALKDIVGVHMRDALALIEEFSNEVDRTMGVYVVAHSLGGPIGMELITKHPDKVRKLLLVEPSWNVLHSLRNGIFSLCPPILFQDDRGPAPTQEMIDNIAPDKAMVRFDWRLFFYKPDKAALKQLPVLFAVGEQSKGRVIYKETVRLAKELDKPLFYHPGVHNTGFNLPKEFAYLVEGALTDTDY